MPSVPAALTFVVPAYNAAGTIGETLASVFNCAPVTAGWQLEVVVVDDGSLDAAALTSIVSSFGGARLVSLETNQGKLAAVNVGIKASRGDIVVILDADDVLVPHWEGVLLTILRNWPPEVPVCFSACRNPVGDVTCSEPGYEGLLTLQDMLNERYSGEYLPIFRGDYIRARGYVALEGVKACEALSYLTLLQDGPFWISRSVLRIYHDRRAGSLSSNWAHQEKALQMVKCYDALFERFAGAYEKLAPRIWRTKRLRYAVYRRLAGCPGAWRVMAKAAHWECWREVLGAVLILLLGRGFAAILVSTVKRLGFVRRYG